ncbi:hypothetical protein ABI59_20740 [Acidobacteria bacterium Mor1]|nr:hypothetical protein ABI59_20740 [Acidobacteria bacterium Mor1]
MARILRLVAALLCITSPTLLLAAESAAPERIRVPGPDHGTHGWCPSEGDLDEYLEALSQLPRSPRVFQRSVPPAPTVQTVDGVFVVEDSGLILRKDRVLDLLLPTSYELTPSGDGYQIAEVPPAYEPVSGADTVIFQGQTSWNAVEVLLGTPLDFGGQSRDRMWITPTNVVAFESPAPPQRVGLCNKGCFLDEGQVLLDRVPRVSPYEHGTSFYGQNAFARGETDRIIVTWQYADPANLDVQVVFFYDGRIRFNYNAVSGIPWGAPLVVTGNDSFWSDLRLGGNVGDPAGDVTIAAPDGPALDLLSASARQVGESELLEVTFTLASPPPADNEDRLFYQLVLRDQANDEETIGSLFYQWQDGAFRWMTEPAAVEGSTFRLYLRLNNLAVTGNSLHLTVNTFRGETPFEQGDSVAWTAEFEPTADAAMLDLSSELPVTTGPEPVYEAFTLPSLQTGEVLTALTPQFEVIGEIEALQILQNLWTDIFFFAGGYHAGGNSGAEGVGFGSSEAPRSPSLLHVNNIDAYSDEEWNMTVLSHEFGHRWLYHFAMEENGEPSRSLNPASSHPAGYVHTPAVQSVYKPLDYSVMGGSWWTDNGNGTFSTPSETDGGSNGFSWHELYLLGLADPAEVADWWYIDNAFPPQPSAYWSDNDTTVAGTRVPVTIEQIIAEEGPRDPAYPQSRQDFLTPMVLVVRPGQFDADDLDTVETMCNTWQTRWNQATAGRSTVRCFFHPPTVDIVDPPGDLQIVPGDTVSFQGTSADGDGDDVEQRWSFSRVIADTTGPGPHLATFTSTGTYPVSLRGVDATGHLAEAPDNVTVTVTCPGSTPTAVVDELRISRENGDLRITWTDAAGFAGDYVVLRGDSREGPFFPEASGVSGTTGVLQPLPAGNAYYKVAVRNGEGCLGSY